MGTFTVHAPPGAGAIDGAERLRFVRERPSFWALVAPPLWLVGHGLWLVLIGWAAIVAALVYARQIIDPTLAKAALVLFWLWFAFAARDLLRWWLTLRGWTLVGLVEARSRDDAERRFFERLAASKATPSPATPAPEAGHDPIAALNAAAGRATPRGSAGVIGFEDLTGGRR